MAVMKRNGHFYIYFRPFKDKKIGLKLDMTSKIEAKRIETMLLTACRSGNYAGLDPVTQEALVRMFQNQGWELPMELSGAKQPQEELTVWKACELFLKYPGIRDSKSRWRHEIALSHLAEKLGKDVPFKALWVPDLRRFKAERHAEGASSATIGREMSTLSRLYGVMAELQLVEQNPVRLLGGLATGGKARQAILSITDVETIAGKCPPWFRSMIWTAFYTGMRRGEIVNLTRKQVVLTRRMIYLGAQDTKEAAPKRVPLSHEAAEILRNALDVSCISSEKVFLIQDRKGTRPPTLETVKNCWPRACEKIGLEKPWPRFHDLRHSWRASARKSGMDWVIAERILGHSTRKLSVAERYGHISDQELLRAVDAMDFDHGHTEIMVGGRLREGLHEKR